MLLYSGEIVYALSGDDVDRIKRSLLSNVTTTTTTTTTNTGAAATTTVVNCAATTNATSPIDGPSPVQSDLAATTAGTLAAVQVSSQTVALDAEDTAAVDELLTAYRESLRVQTELAHDASNDCSSLMPVQLRSHSSASSISDLVNVAELSVRRVIAMAKQVGLFRLAAWCSG